ncbi:MAG: ankyrin repeat domain-containing protein [Bacteroidia bacterium]|nr:ankyrin repeat domain-containing protein [Bacteroidia bacterium]
MTVHYQHSSGSDFQIHLSQLQNLYHLTPSQAVLPALKKTLQKLITPGFSFSSGHLISGEEVSPFIDLIIHSKKTKPKEKIEDWVVMDKQDVCCIAYRLDESQKEALAYFMGENPGMEDQQVLELDVEGLLGNVSDDSLNDLIAKLNKKEIAMGVVANERTLVLNKKVDQASKVSTSVNGIAIPYKEPLKKPSYTQNPEPEQSRRFNPGNPEGPDGNFPIHTSIIKDDLPAVSEYLQMGGDPSLKNKNGDNLLHLAARYNHLEIAELLLIGEAEVNSRNYVYWAPLHIAAKDGLEDMMRLLIKHGAELEARNNRGKTPLHIASIHGRRLSVSILLDAGADIHATMEKDMNPLHLAAWYGQSEIALSLIDLGAEIDAVNEDGNTALHFAAFNGQVRVIKVLVASGANPSIQNKSGETYLQGVNEGYSGEMIRVLD